MPTLSDAGLLIEEGGPAADPRLAGLVPTPGGAIPWDALAGLWPAEFAAMSACPQDPRHHGEGDVATHLRMVLEALVAEPGYAALDAAGRETVFWAAVFHDIGKPATTREEDDGTADGRSPRLTARGHSRLGAAMARARLRALGAPLGLREHVSALVARHQWPFWMIEREAPARAAIESSLVLDARLLILHARADGLGRIAADQAGLLERIALAELLFEQESCLDGPYAFANSGSRIEWLARAERDPGYAIHETYRSRATMLAGLPGAGKDSWIAAHRPGVPVVSLDALRKAHRLPSTGPQGPLFSIAKEALQGHLRAGEDVVFNATNLTRDMRAKWLGLFHAYGAFSEAVWLEPSPAEQRRRNRDRAASVPEAVLDALEAKIEPPSLLEAHAVRWVRNG